MKGLENNSVVIALIVIAICICFISLNEKIEDLKINNSELKSEIEDLKGVNDLFIEDNSKGLLEIYNLTNQIKKLEEDREKLIGELSQEYRTQNRLKETIKQTKKERGLINPTYQELKAFVRKDRTDKKDYNDDYDCTEYSNEFILNFAEEGFFSCSVEIDYKCGWKRCGHILVAINTTDRGLIYLEPQDDNLFSKINVKDNYADIVGWDYNMKITKISSCFELKT